MLLTAFVHQRMMCQRVYIKYRILSLKWQSPKCFYVQYFCFRIVVSVTLKGLFGPPSILAYCFFSPAVGDFEQRQLNKERLNAPNDLILQRNAKNRV
jgi:hypothetical protein